ncbi:uncharacterized protein PGTG_18551 [Puccinia graminis f. sp. tritici CRL 75-36-700-3]|uniref:Uncharacterized protein n=1 Tax=Puccinia graminis f. sp. tritici (strain CRL 75-36-700-3 / race SCCL) TaxID=418459 RepID=E3L7M8_PUCGT|nr:uncharacterized protein PGTG_18551 [Puccinia graminis f. sp. tritici CRL 75-36-700-3]EFP92553.1 hypothetical protein PGTG_18551 [Puccinia graminis f. sp. tritici CRL 75-36-700-3]
MAERGFDKRTPPPLAHARGRGHTGLSGGVPPGELVSLPARRKDSLPKSCYMYQLAGRIPFRRAGLCTSSSEGISSDELVYVWKGTAIGAVLCRRPNVYDLFKFLNSTGLVDIVSANSAFLHQFSHPDTVWSAECSVKSLVSYHVEFISPLATVKHQSGATPKFIRADLKIWPSNPLIRKACYLVQRYIKHNSAFKSTINCLDAVLYEALIGEEVQQAKKMAMIHQILSLNWGALSTKLVG